MDASEVEGVRASLRHLLATHSADRAPGALLGADWLELLAAAPAVAVGVLAEEQGRALASAPLLDLVLLHAAGLPVEADHAFVLPRLHRGSERAAAAFGGRLRVDGILRGNGRAPQRLLIPADAGLVSAAASALELAPVGGFDPQLGLVRVRGEVAADAWSPQAPPEAWIRALAAGRRFLASELIGLVERMLSDSVDYVGARRQFGRAIGSFQAVKHRLADVRVALGAARSAAGVAWQVGDAQTALAGKVLATRAHRLAATHCHQVLGGIAFTLEHGFHRFIQRGHLLDALLGPADALTRALGAQLIAARRVPRVPEIRPA